jgi:hypothetical protein
LARARLWLNSSIIVLLKAELGNLPTLGPLKAENRTGPQWHFR